MISLKGRRAEEAIVRQNHAVSVFRLSASCLILAFVLSRSAVLAATPRIQSAEMAGYLIVPHEKVPETYNAGFSMYVAAWPLLQEYPGHRFQTGLFGTWMFAQYDGPAPANMYSDVEGGLGWWRDTRFPTETPKFIMGGVARISVKSPMVRRTVQGRIGTNREGSTVWRNSVPGCCSPSMA